jgi:hypothetical protein
MAKYTEQQKTADKNWREKHPDKSNYLRARSSARSFIKTKAEIKDLEELKILIKEREEFLLNNM